MRQTKKIIWILIILLGGCAVIGSYIHGFLTHSNAPRILWGGVPAGLRTLYTTCMLVAAAGYFALVNFVVRLDPRETTVFGRFGFGIFNILFLFVLVPSALWMPLTFLTIERSSATLAWIVRLDLALVAAGSAGLLLAALNTRPHPSGAGYILAIVGSAALCLQTVILDAIVWSIYFR